jgi:hypothetical protein
MLFAFFVILSDRRWLRVLFGREFQLENTLIMWDTLFADSPRLDLADYVCVSMLCYIRDDCMSLGSLLILDSFIIFNLCINQLSFFLSVLRGDYSDCLRRLMKFPPVGDVGYIVEQALHIRDPEVWPSVLFHFCSSIQVESLPLIHSIFGCDFFPALPTSCRPRVVRAPTASTSSASHRTHTNRHEYINIFQICFEQHRCQLDRQYER